MITKQVIARFSLQCMVSESKDVFHSILLRVNETSEKNTNGIYTVFHQRICTYWYISNYKLVSKGLRKVPEANIHGQEVWLCQNLSYLMKVSFRWPRGTLTFILLWTPLRTILNIQRHLVTTVNLNSRTSPMSLLRIKERNFGPTNSEDSKISLRWVQTNDGQSNNHTFATNLIKPNNERSERMRERERLTETDKYVNRYSEGELRERKNGGGKAQIRNWCPFQWILISNSLSSYKAVDFSCSSKALIEIKPTECCVWGISCCEKSNCVPILRYTMRSSAVTRSQGDHPHPSEWLVFILVIPAHLARSPFSGNPLTNTPISRILWSPLALPLPPRRGEVDRK